MVNAWFTSDHHFFHKNILKFSGEHGAPLRPFSFVDEMNEHMIEKWNGAVKPGDTVVHLGDFAMKYRRPQDVANIARRLNGNLEVITLGNHDEAAHLVGVFKKLRTWRVFREHKFVATHFPLRPSVFESKGTHLVHGHVHGWSIDDPRFINVSVEVRDYTPVHLDQILMEMRK